MKPQHAVFMLFCVDHTNKMQHFDVELASFTYSQTSSFPQFPSLYAKLTSCWLWVHIEHSGMRVVALSHLSQHKAGSFG